MSTISIVVAIADNYAIGKDQQLLWHLPADMKHFRVLTTGHTIIMGRKTFESLPNGALPKRKNVILTSHTDTTFENAYPCKSLKDALELCKDEEEVFIIGGAQVYHQTINDVDKLYVTHVHQSYDDADAFFPKIDLNQWEEVEREDFSTDEKNLIPYSFVTYIRRK